MTTASEACGVIRTVLEATPPQDGARFGAAPIALFWYGDPDQTLPEFPTPFAFTMFEAERSGVIEIGGGRGANRHRNPALATVYVCTPKDTGQQRATDIAEGVATLFRSYKDNGITCDSATVYPAVDGTRLNPPGSDSDVGNYMVAACEIEFYFDLIG